MKPLIIFLEAHFLLALVTGLGIEHYPHDHINPTTSLSNSLHASNPLHAQPSDLHNPLEQFSVATTTLDLATEISIKVNTTVIPRSSPAATWLEVSWQGVPFPSYDDFIALYPDGADVTATAPIKFKLAARTTPSHLISGSGTALFRVLNLRQPLRFAFIREGLQTPRVAAWSQSITPEEPNYPTQGHLSLPRSFTSSGGSGGVQQSEASSSSAFSSSATTSEIAIQWTTRDKGTSPPTVQWSTTPFEINKNGSPISNADKENKNKINVATGVSSTYTRSEMCGPPANTTGWFDPGWFHYVIMAGLDPGKRYYYKYGGTFEREKERENGDDSAYIWSEEASFIAPPAPTFMTQEEAHYDSTQITYNVDQLELKKTENQQERHPNQGELKNLNKTVKLLAIADLGQAEIDGSMEVSQMWASLQTHAALHWEIVHNTPQLIVHNGDVSYARGYNTQWDSYWDLLGHAVRAVPYMTVPGNHERDWPGTGDGFGDASSRDSGGECGVAYNKRTNMPSTNPDQPWYSFNFGPIHFLQFSTEHAFDPGSPQVKFIEEDLAAVDRTTTPWVVVGGHRPIYLDSISWSPIMRNEDQVIAAALRASLEDVFLKYKVDVTWTGHHHSYQRTCPLAKGKCIYPSGDNSTDSAKSESQQQQNQHSIVHLVIGNAGAGLSPNIHLIQPKEFEVVMLRHGYLRVEANMTHMKHEMVATDTGLVMDEFVLVK